MTAGRLVRAPAPRVLLGPGEAYLFGPRGEACRLEGDHAELVLAVLRAADAPATRDELALRVLAEAGAGVEQRAAVDQAVELLARFGALAGEPPGQTKASPPAAGAHVLVCVTGAIGAAYAPPFIDRLLQAGHAVRVVMTRSARRFVSARTFEAITHRPVETGMWEGTPERPAPHIELARWADVVVVYPATATTIGRIAAGDCAELTSAVATTTRAPVLVAPSMNVEMLRAPAVQDNLETLRSRGFFVAQGGIGGEVADDPAERAKREGVAAPAGHMAQYVSFLVARAAAAGPRLLSRAEWDEEHGRQEAGEADAEIVDAVLAHAAPPARVIEVGAGLGAVARALAARGFVVVATDASRRAVERARAADPGAPVTWAADDAVEPAILGAFDVCVDRGCLGCIAPAKRERYMAAVASRLRPAGTLVVKAHRAPAANLRAYGFTLDDVRAVAGPAFSVIESRETTLDYGEVKGSPALLVVLRKA